MADADKDLAELRKEHKELSDHSGRLAIVFLTILTLLGISFSRAWNEVNGAYADQLVCRIFTLNEERSEQGRSGCSINVSYVFQPRVEKYEDEETRYDTQGNVIRKRCNECPAVVGAPTPTPSPPCDCQTRLTQEPYRRLSSQFSPPTRLEPTASPTPREPTASEDTACQCQRTLEAELEGKAARWFAAQLPIPGVDLHVDLRAWVYVLPVLFALCGLYLYILRKKQQLLWVVGSQRLRQSQAGEVSDLDRLHFEGDAPFHRFPSKLTTFLFVAFYLFMPAYLGYRAWQSWDSGGGAILLFLPLVVVCVGYALAYGYYVRGKFDRQIASIRGAEPRHRMKLFRGLARTVNPAIPLATGSVLVLVSLLLPVTKTSWWLPRPLSNGFRLLTTSFDWITSDAPGYSKFAEGVYAASLLLAMANLLLLVPLVRSRLNKRWFSALVFALTSTILTFFLIDLTLSLHSFFDIPESRIVVTNFALWFIAIAWIFIAAGKLVANEHQFQKHARALFAVFAPTILISIGFVLWLQLPGLIALVAGLLLLVLGSIQVHCRTVSKASEAGT